METVPPDADRLSLDLERMVRALRALLTDDPLSPSASAVLSRLDTDGPNGITALARAERVSQPAMTQLVSRLHAEGLVLRGSAEDDRRAVRVSLSPAGRAALDSRRRARASKVGEALRRLDEEERRTLLAALPAFEHLTAVMHDGLSRHEDADRRPDDA